MKGKISYLRMRISILSLCLSAWSMVSAQPGQSVTGVVTDGDGQPVIAVTVVDQASGQGVVTAADGTYTIAVGTGSKLTFNCVGFESVTIPVDNRTRIDVSMKDDVIGLGEVVVTGYGKSVSRDKLTAAISKVPSQVLESGNKSNPLQSLYGSVTGVRITTTSGQPGTEPTITIRGGTGFDSSGAPLYIVDGMQVPSMADINSNDVESIEVLKDAAATALYGARASNGVVMITTKTGNQGKANINFKASAGFNFFRSTYDFLGAEDYIYWLRMAAYNSGNVNLLTAANGFGTGNVYTHDGNKVGTGIWSTMILSDDNRFLLDYGYKQMTDPIYGDQLIYYEHSARDNSMKDVSTTQEYNLSISGGNDRARFYTSLGWYDEKGFPLKSYYNRVSFRMNASYKANRWLTAKGNVSFSRSGRFTLAGDVMDESRFFEEMLSAPPTQRKYNLAGETVMGFNWYRGDYSVNIDKFYRRTDQYRLTAGSELKADIAKGLYAKAGVMWYMDWQERERMNQEYLSSPGTYNSDRAQSARYVRNLYQTYTAMLGYDVSSCGHTVGFVGGFEFTDRNYFLFSASGQGATSDDFIAMQYIKIDEATTAISTNHTQQRQMSAFANATYDYQGKYLLSFSGRYDGYSKLVNNKWGFFPGVSAAWNLYKEDFMQPSREILSSLKLRAGYGQNGNVDIVSGAYDLQGLYGNTADYDGTYGVLIHTLPYPNLRWEKTTSFDVAVEGSLFNKIGFSVGFFNKKTSDKLATVSYPTSAGVSSQYTNNGSLRSRGIEAELRYNVVKNRDWDVNVGVNYTYVRSKILTLPENGNENNRQGGTQVYDPNTGEVIWVGGYQQGQEYGAVYAWQKVAIVRNEEDLQNYAWYVDEVPSKTIYGPSAWAALTPAEQANGLQLRPGDAIWYDVNGDNHIDTYDRIYMGSSVPRWMGGGTISATWKNLSLFARFDYSGGHVAWDHSWMWYMACGQGTFNTIQDVKKTWTVDNQDAEFPEFLYGNGGRNMYRKENNFTMNKQDYLCAREISLSYALPRKWAQKLDMKDLTLTATGQNLFYLTRSRMYSQEYGAGEYSGYSVPRQLLISLSANF